MIGVTNLNAESWNAAINAINEKAKEAYSKSDKGLTITEKGIAEVKDAMDEMVDAFNAANIYVNFMEDLIYYYKQSIAMGRYVNGTRQHSLAGVNIVPDRGKIS